MPENPFESPMSQGERVPRESSPVRKRDPIGRVGWSVTGVIWLWMAGTYLYMFWDEPEFQSFFWYGAAFLLLAVWHFWLAIAAPLVKKR